MVRTFAIAPKTEHTKNTFTGENLSATLKTAKTNVPIINPDCTAIVMNPTNISNRPSSAISSGTTALPANQREVPANCENTITGKMCLGIDELIFIEEEKEESI